MNRDVDHLERLKKDDILEFYNIYFNPSSPERAKLSVYNIAQASSEEIAANTSESEQRENLSKAISSMLAQLQLPAEPDKLAEYFDRIDLAAPDHVESIVTSVSNYLEKVAGMAAEEAKVIVAQAQAFLPALLPTLGIKAPEPQSNGDANGHANGNGHAEKVKKKESILIKDIKAFRASMALTSAAIPVADISEFEELEPKL